MITLELEFDPVKALAQITIMRNVTLTKAPNHEYIAYFDNIETTLRSMREKNLKLAGRLKAAEQQIDKFNKLGNSEIQLDYEEAAQVEDKLTDEAWLKIGLQSKMW